MAEITREELLARYAAGERNFSGLDLSRLDLSNIEDEKMRAQDHFAFLRENYPLNRCIFRGSNLSYVNFSRTCILSCDFRDTICFQANFNDCGFSGSNFTGADLREANLEAMEGIGVIFENVDFRGCANIGRFVHERTLCLRNCIGSDGTFIELFNEETVREESYRRYLEECDRSAVEQHQEVKSTPRSNIDLPDIPF